MKPIKKQLSQLLPKSKGAFLSRDLIASKAYWKLTGKEKNVFLVFYLKRQLHDNRTKQKFRIRDDSAKMVRNNGEIIFTYAEAAGYGISKSTFTRCIDRLVEVGMLDIAEQGGENEPTKYAISDRWMQYGKEGFVEKKRKKLRNQRIGFGTRFQNTPLKMRVGLPPELEVK